MSRIEFMVRFTISLPELDTTIIGTKNLDHLRENLAAAQKGPLPEELISTRSDVWPGPARSQLGRPHQVLALRSNT